MGDCCSKPVKRELEAKTLIYATSQIKRYAPASVCAWISAPASVPSMRPHRILLCGHVEEIYDRWTAIVVWILVVICEKLRTFHGFLAPFRGYWWLSINRSHEINTKNIGNIIKSNIEIKSSFIAKNQYSFIHIQIQSSLFS